MLNKIKMTLGLLTISLMGFIAIGCGGGGGGGQSHPVIILVGGVYGYYDGNLFCDFTNNYCGTGINDGIGSGGTTCFGSFCPSTGVSTGTSGGVVVSPGSTGTSGGVVVLPPGSTGTSGGTLPISGGSAGTSTGACGTVSCNSSTPGMSVDEDTKDINLQKSEVLTQDFEARVAASSQQFSMSVESARSLTQLSDRMNLLSTQGQLTADDRDALAHSALAVAGINDSAAVSNAVAKMANHDNSAVNTLIDKAAINLGMPSSAGLRDQILPSFGIQIPQN